MKTLKKGIKNDKAAKNKHKNPIEIDAPGTSRSQKSTSQIFSVLYM
jgi:hypothetical protein